MLEKWNPAINLVGRSTLADAWRRHVQDSAQLLAHAPAGATRWLDLGSGAGFPGLVLAILGAGEVHLVESDGRKATFLAEAARLTESAITLHRGRLERLDSLEPDVITARAFAPLPRLLDLVEAQINEKSVFLLLKGQDIDKELTQATKYWKMRVERMPSLSDSHGTVLRLSEVTRERNPDSAGVNDAD